MNELRDVLGVRGTVETNSVVTTDEQHAATTSTKPSKQIANRSPVSINGESCVLVKLAHVVQSKGT